MHPFNKGVRLSGYFLLSSILLPIFLRCATDGFFEESEEVVLITKPKLTGYLMHLPGRS
jgi:hypothetical protein